MGVRWFISFPPEVLTEYAGTKLGQYFTDGEAMLQTQLTSRRMLKELYDLDCVGIRSDPPCYLGVASLGAHVIFPEDEQPMVRNQGRILPDTAEIERLRAPSPYDCELMQRYIAIHHFMCSQVPGEQVGMGHGQAGPISTAVLLRGDAFFEDLYANPRAAHALLSLVTDLEIAFRRATREVSGAHPCGASVSDDFAGCISAPMWPEFVLPYWSRLLEAQGPGTRSLHSELLRREHLRFLPQLGFDVFDPGMDQYLTVKMIREEIDIPFTWNIFTSRDMLQGTPASIQAAYRQAVADGAPMMTVEVCRHTPRENIHAYLEVARALE